MIPSAPMRDTARGLKRDSLKATDAIRFGSTPYCAEASLMMSARYAGTAIGRACAASGRGVSAAEAGDFANIGIANAAMTRNADRRVFTRVPPGYSVVGVRE